jgi:hypothetical protein
MSHMHGIYIVAMIFTGGLFVALGILLLIVHLMPEDKLFNVIEQKREKAWRCNRCGMTIMDDFDGVVTCEFAKRGFIVDVPCPMEEI